MDSTGLPDSTFSLVVFATVLGLAPAALVLTTAFIKISIVFFIVRNAIGLQQTPANIILSGLAAVLAVYISAPVISETYTILRDPSLSYRTISDWEEAFTRGSEPVRAFMLRHTTMVEREFFASATRQVWGEQSALSVDTTSLFVLIPSFIMHEITAAFKIGFLIYIPFLAIDLIVANVLMALGMITMSPVVVGVPFKLLLFVAVDGWNLLVRGLILSYAAT
jgi:type III secretion protein R